MAKKNELSEADVAVFREAMRGVKPLPLVPKVSAAQPKSTTRVKRIPAHETEDKFHDNPELESLSSDALVEYKQSGIQNKILRKMRGGQYNVQAILDLHGKTVAEARESLHQFLMKCLTQGTKYALIIHGKGKMSGKPILKNKLNQWLRQVDYVLAFCSATAREGRSGAMYVLLKNKKGEKTF